MFSQQQIFDSPEKSGQPPQSPLQPVDHSQIKKSLIEAFQTLCLTTPSQSALSKSHTIIGEQMKLPEALEVMLALVAEFSASNQTLTKLVITQIFTYMKKQSSFGFEQRHNKFKTNQLLISFFIDSQVDFKFKKMLQNTYMHFIFVPQNIKLRKITTHFIDDKLTKLFSTTANSYKTFEHYNSLASPISILIPPEDIIDEPNLKLCLSLLHLLRCLLVGGNLQVEILTTILPSCFSIYYQVILSTVKTLFLAVQMKEEGLFNVKVDECAKFTELLVLIYSKMDSGKFPELRERILHTRQIYRLLTVLLSVSPEFTAFAALKTMLAQNLYPQGQQPNFSALSLQIQKQMGSLELEKTFVKWNASVYPADLMSKRIILNLKMIKKNAIQILIKCVKAIGKKQIQTFSKYPYLSAVITNLWVKVKQCLITETEIYLKSIQPLSQQAQLCQTNRQHQQMLSTSIKFLSSCIKVPSMYTVVSPYHNQVIFKLCFPWLISRKEHGRFSAQDYLFFREDVINKQNMSFIENNIGALIQAYMDNIDGVVTAVMQNSLLVIEYHLTKNANCLEGLAPEVRDAWVLEYYAPERQIESGLTLIAIESYLSLPRNDIALNLQKFIHAHKSFFLSLQNDHRITLQFLMMYSYYVDNFYSNSIQGISSQSFVYRQLHQEVLKFCCYLMKASYNYDKNQYQNRNCQILYFVALDCLNNSLNHSELSYVLYCNFPPKEDLLIPHYMQPYENYPFYPRKRVGWESANKKKHADRGLEDAEALLNHSQHKERREEEAELEMRQLNMHYRKLGLNKEEYFEKEQLLSMIQFLSQNLESKANIKIIELLIEVSLSLVRQQLKNQGTVLNIPCLFREDIASHLALRMYTFLHSKPQNFPNRNLFQTKATELLYVLHTISSDAYYIYSMGLEVLWMNVDFWNFDPMEDDNDVDKLLKCTDLVVRLAMKHYSSQKGVDVKQLMEKIAANFAQYSFLYINKMCKFNVVFGILLNLILLKVSPQTMFDFLYLLITQKLMKAELSQHDSDSEQNPNEISSLTASELLSLAFYLFLANIYRNPDCLNTQKNYQLLKVFHQYLTHYTNAHQIVTQLGDVFGKVFACCLCIIEREFQKDTLKQWDANVVEFFWRNLLYSSKIYKSELQMRVVAVKLMSIIREVILRNDSEFSFQRLQLMYQTVCSCVFYSKNKDLLMMNEEGEEDFDHAGEEEDWQNEPITLLRNDTSIYLQDDVHMLKSLSRQLLESENPQKKQWITKLIESLPVAVRNFVKNKVINYQQDSKELGLRKILKVKRPQGLQAAVTKQEIIRENAQNLEENSDGQK